jgi:riboflavin biosynthesis pyrimidine reductase
VHVIWYTAMSMDGRIADSGGSLDFLDSIAAPPEQPGGGDEFSAFLASVDAILVGASTLRWLLREGHGWPHGDRPTWLLSHDPALVKSVGPTEAEMHRVEGAVEAVFASIERAGHQRVWLCGGGAVAAQALAADRVDEVIVTIAPTALGAGPALFDGDDLQRRRFRLDECRDLGNRAARLRWSRDRSTEESL